MKTRELIRVSTAEAGNFTANVSDYDHILIHVLATDNPNATLKVRGGVCMESPQFDEAVTKDNLHAGVAIVDLTTGGVVTGDTGIEIEEDMSAMYEVNTNHMTWLDVAVEDVTSGEVTVVLVAKQSAQHGKN